MITTTARDLIRRSLIAIGVKAAGEALDADDGNEALQRLNALIDAWGVQYDTMLSIDRTTFPMTANQQNYTIGPLGNITTIAPPIYLNSLRYILNTSPAIEIPLGMLTDDGYEAIAIKDLSSPLPTQAYYTRTSPSLSTIILWPVPSQTGLTLVIYAPQPVAQFPDLSTDVILAPAYERALRWNLAMELAADYGRPPEQLQQVFATARESLADLKRSNVSLNDMPMDPAIAGWPSHAWYNILNDTP